MASCVVIAVTSMVGTVGLVARPGGLALLGRHGADCGPAEPLTGLGRGQALETRSTLIWLPSIFGPPVPHPPRFVHRVVHSTLHRFAGILCSFVSIAERP
jgi:hypothetical protein